MNRSRAATITPPQKQSVTLFARFTVILMSEIESQQTEALAELYRIRSEIEALEEELYRLKRREESFESEFEDISDRLQEGDY